MNEKFIKEINMEEESNRNFGNQKLNQSNKKLSGKAH
jgi:hypothetical protein